MNTNAFNVGLAYHFQNMHLESILKLRSQGAFAEQDALAPYEPSRLWRVGLWLVTALLHLATK